MIIGLSGYVGVGKDTVGAIIQYLSCKNVGNTQVEDILEDYSHHEWWLEEQSEWEIKKFAGKLKEIASLLTGISVKKFEDQEFKRKELGKEWTIERGINALKGPLGDNAIYNHFNSPLTVREFLQRLGTDALRNHLHENIWVNALFANYVPVDVEYNGEKVLEGKYHFSELNITTNYDTATTKKNPNWIITDCRFPNEAIAIKERGGILVRVNRPDSWNRAIAYVNDNGSAFEMAKESKHSSETGLDNWDFDYVINNNRGIEELTTKVKSILEDINKKYERSIEINS